MAYNVYLRLSIVRRHFVTSLQLGPIESYCVTLALAVHLAAARLEMTTARAVKFDASGATKRRMSLGPKKL